MKKNYMKPNMKVVELKSRQMLLAGSAVGTKVYSGSGYYADEDEETLQLVSVSSFLSSQLEKRRAHSGVARRFC